MPAQVQSIIGRSISLRRCLSDAYQGDRENALALADDLREKATLDYSYYYLIPARIYLMLGVPEKAKVCHHGER